MQSKDEAPEKKKVEELITRYQFEPSIRDVFVEGRSDAALLKKFLQTKNLRHVVVYEISSVEIPAEVVLAAGQPDGVRGRVVYLAFEFDKALPATSKAVSCVADRDYDLLLGRTFLSPFLLFVDYCCIEMYAFNANALNNLLNAIAPAIGKTGEAVLKELEPLLRRLFLIRAANIGLALNMKWLSSFDNSCTLKNGEIRFDEEDFIKRYLNKNALLSQKDGFIKILAELTAKAKGDVRLFVRGHDFVHVLSWYLREQVSKSSPLYKPEVLEQLVLAHIDPVELAGEKFFGDLAQRASLET
jgi:hypothetical protein